MRETVIADVAIRTPLVRLQVPDVARREIWLKLECLQPIGSFKIRGAANAIRQAPRGVRRGRRAGRRAPATWRRVWPGWRGI